MQLLKTRKLTMASSDNGVILSEYQKKLKTMKKKFFVLHKETINSAARLEYYDTEKKFIQNAEPKRVIYLKSCFNINQRYDTKHKFVLALSSREGGFGMVLNSESDLRRWLENLLSIQRENTTGADQGYTSYEYVWQVIVQKKGMSVHVGITGSYHCCLTSKSLTFICIGPEKLANGDNRIVKVEILLNTIRRCGHASPQNIFYMELGRQSVLGSGELWMETEDSAIAKHMHDMILSAMSAKSESNMNLLNVYKGHSDLSNEPMRKRSSSANEASKPINVLQKRQNQTETRNSFSPQYNSYGRERCDSLPTRNRTLSECSNQTYIALKHGHRCNTISGSRPYFIQRHTDSPPTYSIKCSESEESSISIDEANEKSNFDAYRINSRTSKAMIPEENIDEDVQDNSKVVRINGTGPIRGSNSLLNVADEDLKIDFPEHSPEKLEQDADVDNKCERPSRAYSIGSRVEHFKLSKLLGNINELDNTSPRVRAYSVGSKSKIPRCDIQRGVLFSKLTNGHHHKGSICNVDVQTCSEIIGLNTPKEIKSTSAPLLNLRNYISPVRMSDLMEIDFSNVTQVSTTSQQQRMFKNCEVPVMQNETLAQKRIASDNPNSYGNIKRTEMNQQSDLTSKYKVKKCGENSDTGYLEMKPVGKVYPNFKQLSLDDQMEKLRLQNQCLRLGAMQDEPNNSGCCVMSERNGDLKESQHTTNINIYNAENLDKSFLTSEEHTKLEKNKKENAILNCGLDIGNTATVGRKLIHSISNEDYTKHVNKSNAYDTKEVGYQILQIKSDSSLISKKKNQRPSYKQQISRQIHLEGLKKVDRNEAILNTPTKCKLLNEKESNVLNEGVLSEHILDQDATGLSSGLCEYELYYASLDLPQCSGQMATNSLKKVSCESSPTPICFESNSSYAKIDFDQSDSSSASSKICNI
ncbi:insulin receptor substrate 1 isoform X2 [Drosophila novamexicana]|uniref:insulin receptor substrate 1 isoform X2 n=1 Tax=Drosophila novamexicana TaxID=47314 RepID=UPI0011E5EA32|nr:insulin receptor substrate 1 isoform X2 [Drosophila novamexicana]